MTLPDCFKDIADYPRCACEWGDDVVVLCVSPEGPMMYVAHLEGGDWMAKNPEDGGWGDCMTPIAFMPLPLLGRKSHLDICTCRTERDIVASHAPRVNSRNGATIP